MSYVVYYIDDDRKIQYVVGLAKCGDNWYDEFTTDESKAKRFDTHEDAMYNTDGRDHCEHVRYPQLFHIKKADTP